jgi:hypothetical protein
MTEEDIGRSEELDKEVEPVGEFKQFVVNYVGHKRQLEEKVTVEDIVMVFAEEFPEFLLAVAEENFIRGYKQAMDDLHTEQPEVQVAQEA